MVSTQQEMDEQYAHPIYMSALEQLDKTKFEIIPPGVNENIFSQTAALPKDKALKQKLDAINGINRKPVILVSSRLDEKKNIMGASIKAYSENSELNKRVSDLVLCFRGINDPAADILKLSNKGTDSEKYLK